MKKIIKIKLEPSGPVIEKEVKNSNVKLAKKKLKGK